jgi:dachs protein
MQTQKNIQPVSAASTTWALGKRHIFLSEGARQQLEMLRSERRIISASLIQATWRGWNLRRRWPLIKQSLIAQNVGIRNNNVLNAMAANAINRPRPQPITGTPPPFGTPQQTQSKSIEMCDQNVIQETCTLFGIDLVRNLKQCLI